MVPVHIAMLDNKAKRDKQRNKKQRLDSDSRDHAKLVEAKHRELHTHMFKQMKENIDAYMRE